MGTRLTLVFETDKSIEDLQQMVHELDEFESGPGEGIAPENVTAWDVVTLIATGDISLVTLIGNMTLEELARSNKTLAELDGVTVNKMEEI
jgi:hypothetical protein